MASFGDFQQFLQREQITVLNLPVSYWQEWVLELSHSGTHLPPTLRVQIVGSEQVPPDRLVDWQQLAGDDVAWYNAYGPTEATITTTIYHPGKQRENKDAATVSIGRPISNVQIYILDQYLQPTPIGVPGELHIGGMSLARGYLHHFMLTAEKFIPHPFSDTPGARLYKTGDLARYRSDGSIECLGRIDQQVKIRGFRIELGEIEAALRRHPSVREAIASVYGDNQRGKRLLAYVVTEPGTRCQPSELRTFLWQHLPGHMIPSSYMFINEMPRMPNGKVDRHALPVPDGINFERESAFALPQTVTEEALTRIWTQVLGVKRIGIHDNFFELGGDSILSIQIVARARQAGIHLNLQHLFQHQTIAELAAVAGVGVPVQAEQGLVTGMVPFTPIQKWFFEQPLACLHHYNQARLLLVQKPLELGLLEQAVQQLLTHHDALRMRFFQDGGIWRQMCGENNVSAVIAHEDLSSIPQAEQGVAIEMASSQLQASLQLTEGPLVRGILFDLGVPNAQRLLLIVHHLVVDGVSWRILLEDLQDIYHHLQQGKKDSLRPKTTSLKRWAELLVEYAQSADLHLAKQYWITMFQTPVAL